MENSWKYGESCEREVAFIRDVMVWGAISYSLEEILEPLVTPCLKQLEKHTFYQEMRIIPHLI